MLVLEIAGGVLLGLLCFRALMTSAAKPTEAEQIRALLKPGEMLDRENESNQHEP